MHSQYTKNRRLNGFTIVETIVVIAVIGILATIVAVGYNSWQRSTIEAQLKSDLTNVASAMENYRNFNNGYPASIPSTFTASEGVVLTVDNSDSSTYCIDAVSSKDGSITYYIPNRGRPTEGTCTDYQPGVPPSIATSSLAGGVAGTPYSQTIAVSGDSPITFSVQSGSLPAGLSLNNSSGIISGNPTSSGLSNFVIKATNGSGSDTKSLSINILNPPPAPPTGISITIDCYSKALYSWSPNGEATSYDIQFAGDSNFTVGLVTVNTSGTSGNYTLSGYSTYYSKVRSVSSSGPGAYSAVTQLNVPRICR